MNAHIPSALFIAYATGFLYIISVINISNNTFLRYPSNSRWVMRSVLALLWPCMVIQKILFIIINVILDSDDESEDDK